MSARDSIHAPLTSLRFFLASWIVWFHLYVGMRPGDVRVPMGWPLHNTVRCAYVAVGIFFLLSGFLLAMNYPPAKVAVRALRRRFFVARLSRVYPVYLLALLAIAPAIIAPAMADHSLALRRAVSGTLNLLMLQAWVPQAALTWNGPGWSLSCEAFFYACFPWLARYFLGSVSVRAALRVVAGLWIAQLAAPLACTLAHVRGYGDMAATGLPETTLSNLVGFNPLLSLPLFLTGVVACRIYRLIEQDGSLTGKGYLLYGPSLLVLFACTSLGSHIPYPLMHNGLLLPVSLTLILGLALGDRYLCRLMSNRALVFLGKASYAEYLLHFPIRWMLERRGVLWTPLHQLEYFGFVLVIAAIVFRFFEEPMQRTIRGWLDPSRRAPASGSADVLPTLELG